MDLEPGVNGLCPVNASSFINSFNKCLLIARRPCARMRDKTRLCLLLVGRQTPKQELPWTAEGGWTWKKRGEDSRVACPYAMPWEAAGELSLPPPAQLIS